MNKYIYIFLVILLSFSICSFAQAPDWATTNTHKKYPSSAYLLGVGISNDKTQAIDLARADVAKQIQVKIESELEAVEQEIGKNGKNTVQSEITSKTKSVVSETIAGIEIKETVQKKNTFYALAVLNKANYIAGLKQDVDDVSSAISVLYQNGKDLAQGGDIIAALESYVSAENKSPEYYVKHGLYTALTGNQYKSAGSVSPAEIETEAISLLSSINILVVGGNNQSGKIGLELSEPIRIRVILSDGSGQDIGLNKIPITVKYANGEMICKQLTNQTGELSVNVLAAPGGKIVITPIFKGFPERFRDNIPKIEAVAMYTAVAENIPVSIDIKNLSGDQDQDLEKIIAQNINESGGIIDPASGFFVRGQFAVSNEKQINSPSGTQYFIETELILKLENKVSGNQVATITGSGKGLAVGSRDQAVRKACENIQFSSSKMSVFIQNAKQP